MNETITLAGGCFWCIEALFANIKGVNSAISGYTGGKIANPTYEQVCSGNTGHAEAVQINFDNSVVTLHDLLIIFFTLHDPTTLNRQGNDAGTQYRSAIFYENEGQKSEAEEAMNEITNQAIWPDPLVTELIPLEVFYKAEEYHQNYFARNENQGYCRVIIAPKVVKLRKLYQEKLKV